MPARRKLRKISWDNLHQSTSSYCTDSVEIKSLKNVCETKTQRSSSIASKQARNVHISIQGQGEDWEPY